jgi:hypothetical protein
MAVDHEGAHPGRAGELGQVTAKRRLVDRPIRGEGGEGGGPDAADASQIHAHPGKMPQTFASALKVGIAGQVKPYLP